jgi:hypothetical protein
MALRIDDPQLESRLAFMAQRMGETVEEVVVGILSEECDRAEAAIARAEGDRPASD